ncbi:hypothetical protein VNO80_09993 [Phaseolus coccineus]|uniref:Uncharacterized protein n=1 Tax=Phaseolus coccineus TaxID=3886 RepID=A0AAN9NCL9_PHACN
MNEIVTLLRMRASRENLRETKKKRKRQKQTRSAEPNEMIEKRAKKKNQTPSPPKRIVLPSSLRTGTLPFATILRSSLPANRSE